jgi:hypothetical protein
VRRRQGEQRFRGRSNGVVRGPTGKADHAERNVLVQGLGDEDIGVGPVLVDFEPGVPPQTGAVGLF